MAQLASPTSCERKLSAAQLLEGHLDRDTLELQSHPPWDGSSMTGVPRAATGKMTAAQALEFHLDLDATALDAQNGEDLQHPTEAGKRQSALTALGVFGDAAVSRTHHAFHFLQQHLDRDTDEVERDGGAAPQGSESSSRQHGFLYSLSEMAKDHTLTPRQILEHHLSVDPDQSKNAAGHA
eukprot:gnl/TRDRNA2_/TRDRNA2_128555_c0_seq1.p1 gnl/TRDRNA2_/TRDRNA2_128555_c0~~gnl/TRDRNA2_/TRDRNA2_128555_c0_seq1.p1  ORF type:complete len:181 (-),score=35.83 gnl/TRDRNA2_/TRDRNA2_128555_c0_seq1:14-556(-)